MKRANTPYLLTLPCDAPHIAPYYVNRLISSMEISNANIVVCHDGKRMQPLHALIAVNMLDNLAAWLQGGERAVNRWFRDNHAVTADFSDAADMFANINTPEQYQDTHA